MGRARDAARREGGRWTRGRSRPRAPSCALPTRCTPTGAARDVHVEGAPQEGGPSPRGHQVTPASSRGWACAHVPCRVIRYVRGTLQESASRAPGGASRCCVTLAWSSWPSVAGCRDAAAAARHAARFMSGFRRSAGRTCRGRGTPSSSSTRAAASQLGDVRSARTRLSRPRLPPPRVAIHGRQPHPQQRWPSPLRCPRSHAAHAPRSGCVRRRAAARLPTTPAERRGARAARVSPANGPPEEGPRIPRRVAKTRPPSAPPPRAGR